MSRSQIHRTVLAMLRRACGDPAAHCAGQGAAPDRARRRLVSAAAGAAATSALPLGFVQPRAARASGQIAIVGAGLAGLACADWLAGRGLRADVFEASDRPGGRCRSLDGFFPGQVAELGGEFIDTTHTTMRGYATRFGLTLENVEKAPGETFYFFAGQRYSEAQVVEEFRAFVPAMRADLRRVKAPTADRFTLEESRLDRTSLAEYLDTRGAGRLIRAVIDVAYTIEYGRAIEEQSCLAFLQYAHADRRSKFAPFGVFSDERFHVVEGNDRIATRLAMELPGQVAYAHGLEAARRRADGRVELAFATPGGPRVFAFDAVVLAIPFSVLREVALDVSLELPPWKRLAIETLSYGTNSKMMLGFQGPFWYSLLGSSGSAYSDLANHQNTWQTNPTRATGQSAILTDYSGGPRGERLDPGRVQIEATRFLEDLERVYPGAQHFVSRAPDGRIVAVLENWARNPLYRGSYTCNQPGYFTTIAGNEAKPVGNLFFAGEHTSPFYEAQGFMEGAVTSGLRAAREVFDFLRKG